MEESWIEYRGRKAVTIQSEEDLKTDQLLGVCSSFYLWRLWRMLKAWSNCHTEATANFCNILGYDTRVDMRIDHTCAFRIISWKSQSTSEVHFVPEDKLPLDYSLMVPWRTWIWSLLFWSQRSLLLYLSFSCPLWSYL